MYHGRWLDLHRKGMKSVACICDPDLLGRMLRRGAT